MTAYSIVVMLGAHNAHEPSSILGRPIKMKIYHSPIPPPDDILEEMRLMLDYDSITGKIYRFKIKQQIFRECGAYNNGYLMVTIKDVEYYCHHVAWFLHYKIWPELQIDHKDRNRQNNKILNLTEATYEIQNANTSRASKYGTGIRKTKFGKYSVSYKGKYLFTLDTNEDAKLKRENYINKISNYV